MRVFCDEIQLGLTVGLEVWLIGDKKVQLQITE